MGIHIGNVAFGAGANEMYVSETVVGEELQQLLSKRQVPTLMVDDNFQVLFSRMRRRVPLLRWV